MPFDEKRCDGCTMPREFRHLCTALEQLYDEVQNVPHEERFPKYGRIVQNIMFAAVAMATEITNEVSMLDLVKTAIISTQNHDKLLEALAPSPVEEALEGLDCTVVPIPVTKEVLQKLRRIMQGGKDANELKYRAMLNKLPDDAPRN